MRLTCDGGGKDGGYSILPEFHSGSWNTDDISIVTGDEIKSENVIMAEMSVTDF